VENSPTDSALFWVWGPEDFVILLTPDEYRKIENALPRVTRTS